MNVIKPRGLGILTKVYQDRPTIYLSLGVLGYFDFATPDAFNNGLVFDDLEFDTAGAPPTCPAPSNPTVSLVQPTPGTAVQINEFMLQGSVATAAPLDQATLTASSPNGTKSSNLLGTILQPTSAPFGATRV